MYGWLENGSGLEKQIWESSVYRCMVTEAMDEGKIS